MGSISKALRPLTTSKSFGLLHSLTPIVAVDPNVVSNPYHPLNHTVRERLKAEETCAPRLVVNVIATKKHVSKHSVVRNKAVRRVREAVYESLKERGYGKEGDLLENGMKQSKEHLVGTLSFSVRMESVLTGWGDLKVEVGTAIDRFIALRQSVQQKYTYGTRGGPGTKGRYGVGWGQPQAATEWGDRRLYQRKPPGVNGGRFSGAEGGGQSSYQRNSQFEGYGNRWSQAAIGDGGDRETSHKREFSDKGFGGRREVVAERVKGNLPQGKPSWEGRGRSELAEARWQRPQGTHPWGREGMARKWKDN